MVPCIHMQFEPNKPYCYGNKLPTQSNEYESTDPYNFRLFWLDSGNNADIIVLFVSTIFTFVEFMCRTPVDRGNQKNNINKTRHCTCEYRDQIIFGQDYHESS